MVELTLLNGDTLYINPDLIEFMSETPDTVIFMSTGRKQIVKESVSQIMEKIVVYKRLLFSGSVDYSKH